MLACFLTYVILMSTIAVGAEQISMAPSLIGGRIADDDELPFSVNIRKQGRLVCSANIVGPEVLLTAGHCLSGSRDSFQFEFEGRERTADCTRHPQFNNNSLNNDFALCRFSGRINDDSAFADLSPEDVSVGDAVTLQGFGQNRVGTLQIGNARIVEINGQDIKTNSQVRLGGGDSGGGLLLGNVDTRRGPFRIVGVNSRVGGTVSFFNRTNLARSQDFFEDFARDERVDICGVNRNCLRNNNNDCNAEEEIVDFFKGELADAERLLDQCLRGRKN